MTAVTLRGGRRAMAASAAVVATGGGLAGLLLAIRWFRWTPRSG